MFTPKRISFIVASMSAAALVALVQDEGYTSHTIVPVAGDRPTNGFGSTFDEKGKPIKMGDTVTPQKALARVLIHSDKDKAFLDKCIGDTPVVQVETDLLLSHAYQYGADKTCGSTIVKKLKAGDYVGSCEAYSAWKFVGKRDCSIRSNGCYGVYTRAVERTKTCLAAQ